MTLLRGKRVLVLGDYRQTVTVVRSLARAGLEVVLGCEHPRSPTTYSRYVSRTWVYGPCDDSTFLARLRRYLICKRPDLVFPVGESILRRLLPASAEFESLAIWVNPDARTLESCFDKRILYAIAPGLGIPTLPWQPFRSAAAWRSSACAMGFPVVVKRKDSAAQHSDRKAFIFVSEQEFGRFLDAIESDPDRDALLLQKYDRGARHNCHVAAAGGRLVAYFQQKVLRTDELDGTGIGTAGISVEPTVALREHCERLTRELGYTGAGCIQFLVEESTGRMAFLEFNARLDSTCALPYRLGYDFPRLAVDLALWRASGMLAAAPTLDRGYAPRRRYHWLCGDLNAWLSAARGRHCGAAQLTRWMLNMAALAVRSHHLTFEWRDPVPTLQMLWQTFGRRALAGPQARISKPPVVPGKV